METSSQSTTMTTSTKRSPPPVLCCASSSPRKVRRVSGCSSGTLLENPGVSCFSGKKVPREAGAQRSGSGPGTFQLLSGLLGYWFGWNSLVEVSVGAFLQSLRHRAELLSMEGQKVRRSHLGLDQLDPSAHCSHLVSSADAEAQGWAVRRFTHSFLHASVIPGSQKPRTRTAPPCGASTQQPTMAERFLQTPFPPCCDDLFYS